MEISGRTRLLGLIGSPVEHSGSPAMYNYCFEKYDLDYRYLAFNIPLEKTWEAVEANIRHIESRVPSCKMALYDLADAAALRRELETSDILTNATQMGMASMEDQSLITDLSLLRPDLVVADTVYHPLETKLLKDAKAAGCKTAQGLGMLLWQGAVAFALYSGGLEMPVDEVRAKCFPNG